MKSLFLIIALLVSVNLAYAGGQEKKLLKSARKELSRGHYSKAKEHYLELLSLDASNDEYLFETGLAYFNSGVEKEKSVGYFEKALKNSSDDDLISETYYYLGRSYQYVGEFEKATEYYNKFKDHIKDNNDGVVLSRDVDRFIQMCNNGSSYAKTSDNDVTIVNLEQGVNTDGSEYAPVVNKANDLLIYTGRTSSSTGGKFYHDNQRYEDIFVSNYKEDAWGGASKFDSSNVYISKDINSKWHDAAIAYNEDETKLYIYRKNHVWLSTKENDKWSAPVKMNKNVNSKGHEPSVFITADEQTLYVVSTDRKGGVGGRDIYVSKKDGENWGELELLSGNINTEYDEDAPFITKDGKTMYFSSNGHTTMGGYDVFKSELQDDGTWGEPVNLGSPINTPGDDIYYVQDDEGIMAYYSSSQKGGYGNMDIYMIQLECKSIPKTEIKGILLAGSKQFPIGAELVVYDSETGEEIARTNTDPQTGRYLLVLEPEKSYRLEVKADDPWFVERNHEENFDLPKQCDPFPLYQEIAINRLKDENGKEYAQEALFQNAFFNVEDSVKTLYNIPGTDNALAELPEDSLQLNIGGQLKFNDALEVSEDAKVYLLNSRNEIVRISQTNKEGDFLFRNLNLQENYYIALDEEDMKYAYYGSSPNNDQNGVIVKGHVEKVYRNNALPKENMDSIDVVFFDANKKVTNLTMTDVSGDFVLDNLPESDSTFKHLANTSFVYNIDSKELDYSVSALIHTIDHENNGINYTEVIDIIELDTTGPPPGGCDYTLETDKIYFDFDKYFLRSKSKQVLDKVFDYLNKCPDVSIQLDGHTDWYGTNAYNEKLSENRANSAMKYLIEKGIDENRVSVKWHGETMPAVPNANPDGSDNADNRQKNRRVDVSVKTRDMAFVFSQN